MTRSYWIYLLNLTHKGPSPTRLPLTSTISIANTRKNISKKFSVYHLRICQQGVFWPIFLHTGWKKMCPEFCFVSINLSLRNYWPWILELQMDSLNKYPVRRQPLCYGAFSLQMLFLYSSSPLRRIYLSDFSCMRILGRFLSLPFQETHIWKNLWFAYFYGWCRLFKMLPLTPPCMRSSQINSSFDFSVGFAFTLCTQT